MQTYKYSFFVKIIYKYANIPSSLILLIYLLASVLALGTDWKFVFPLLITIILLYVLNRFYIRIYKSFPFLIEIDNTKMICSDFIIGNRNIEIKHEDIINIKGGIFSGRAYMPLYITTKKVNIGISPHIKDYNKLLTTLLTNIPKELYTSLLTDIKKIAFDNTPQAKKKKKHSKK